METVEWYIKQYMRGSWELGCNANANLDLFLDVNLSEGNSEYEPKLRDRIRGQKIHLTNAVKLLRTARQKMEEFLVAYGKDWTYPEYPDDKLYGRMLMVPDTIDPATVRGDTQEITFPTDLDSLLRNNAIFADDIIAGHNWGQYVKQNILPQITPANAEFIADFFKVLDFSMDGCAWSKDCLGNNLQATVASLSTPECDQEELRTRYARQALDPSVATGCLMLAADPAKVAAHGV